jgi:hypothetical protein
MKIYLKTGANNHLMFVTPGVDSDCSDWRNADGTNKQFTVRFKDGVADVPSNLGDYLIAKGAAQSAPANISPIIRAQDVLPEVRVRNHRVLRTDPDDRVGR